MLHYLLKNKFIKLHKIYKRTNKNNIVLFFIEDKKGKLLSVLNFIPPKLKSIVQKLYFLYFIKKSHCSNLNLCYNNYKRNKGDKE